MDIHDQGGPPLGLEGPDGAQEFVAHHLLDADIEGQRDVVCVVGKQALIERLLDSRQAPAIDIRVADDVGCQRPLGPDAPFLDGKVETRLVEVAHRLLRARFELAADPFEPPGARQQPEEMVAVHVREDLEKRRRRRLGIRDLGRIDIERSDRQARGEQDAVAIDNVGTLLRRPRPPPPALPPPAARSSRRRDALR